MALARKAIRGITRRFFGEVGGLIADYREDAAVAATEAMLFEEKDVLARVFESTTDRRNYAKSMKESARQNIRSVDSSMAARKGSPFPRRKPIKSGRMIKHRNDKADFTQSLKQTAKRNIESVAVREKYTQRPLSEKVWRTKALADGLIGREINKGLARGASADEIAKAVIHMVRPDTPGGVSYAAKRLGRTEINNAFHFQAKQDAQNIPWINQMRWHLSKVHEDDPGDACEDYEQIGFFPVEKVPDKPHPNCRCFVTPVNEPYESFEQKLIQGHYDEHIREQLGDETADRIINKRGIYPKGTEVFGPDYDRTPKPVDYEANRKALQAKLAGFSAKENKGIEDWRTAENLGALEFRFQAKYPGIDVVNFNDDNVTLEDAKSILGAVDDMATKYPQLTSGTGSLNTVVLGWGPDEEYARAIFDGRRTTIKMNLGWTRDREHFLERRASNVEIGFAPPNVDIDPYYDLMVHELGHALDNVGDKRARELVQTTIFDYYNNNVELRPTLESVRAQLKAVEAKGFANPSIREALEKAGLTDDNKLFDETEIRKRLWANRYRKWYKENVVSDYSLTAEGNINPAEALAEAFLDVERNGENARPLSKVLNDLLIQESLPAEPKSDIVDFVESLGSTTNLGQVEGPTTESIYKLIRDNGGVTIDLEGKQPNKGFAFAPKKKTEVVVPEAEFTPEHIDRFIDNNIEELTKKGNNLGVWFQDGNYYIDVSRVGDPIVDTVEAAQKAEQLAVFDLETFEEIQIGKIENGRYVKLDEASRIVDQYRADLARRAEIESEGSVFEIPRGTSTGDKQLKDRQVEEILDLLGVSDVPPAKPTEEPKEDSQERYIKALLGQEDRTKEATVFMPVADLKRYREYDRSGRVSAKQVEALEYVIKKDGGIKSPLLLSTDGKTAMLHEGNHRLLVAERLGITELPVKITLDKEVIRNQGFDPQTLDENLKRFVKERLSKHDHEKGPEIYWTGPKVVAPSDSYGVASQVDYAWMSNFDQHKEVMRRAAKELERQGYSGPPEIKSWDMNRFFETEAGREIVGKEIASRAIHSEPEKRKLFRGLVLDERDIAKYERGQEVSLPLSSFATNFSDAKEYALGDEFLFSSVDREGKEIPVVLELLPGAKTAKINVDPTDGGLALQKRENVVFGRFKIVDIKDPVANSGNPKTIVIQQVSLLEDRPKSGGRASKIELSGDTLLDELDFVKWDGPSVAEPIEDDEIWEDINTAWQSITFDETKHEFRKGARDAQQKGYDGPTELQLYDEEFGIFAKENLGELQPNPYLYGKELVAKAIQYEPDYYDLPLYRGVRLQPNLAHNFMVGQELSMPLSSFTDQQDWAEDFAFGIGWQSRDSKKSGVPIVFELEPGYKVAELLGEKVAFGKFKVVRIEYGEQLSERRIKRISNALTGVKMEIPTVSPTIVTIKQVSMIEDLNIPRSYAKVAKPVAPKGDTIPDVWVVGQKIIDAEPVDIFDFMVNDLPEDFSNFDGFQSVEDIGKIINDFYGTEASPDKGWNDEEMGLESAKELGEAYLRMNKKYPEVGVAEISNFEMIDNSTLAVTYPSFGGDKHGSSIELNATHFRDLETFKRNINDKITVSPRGNPLPGFHPVGAKENPARSTYIHEFGHALDNWITGYGLEGWDEESTFYEALLEAYQEAENLSLPNELSKTQIRDFRRWTIENLSGYSFEPGGQGKLNRHEAISEALDDVERNGDNAFLGSKALHSLIIDYYNQAKAEQARRRSFSKNRKR